MNLAVAAESSSLTTELKIDGIALIFSSQTLLLGHQTGIKKWFASTFSNGRFFTDRFGE